MIAALLACAADVAPPPGPPRSPEAARAALEALGADVRCEGGVLGEGPTAEISWACAGTLDGRTFEASAVTTALALPAPERGVGRLVGDLWVEVWVEGRDAGPLLDQLDGLTGVPAAGREPITR